MTTKTKVECCYSKKCVDAGKSHCTSCTHNEKRSYYNPVQPNYWIWPYVTQPYRGYQPYYPTWTATSTAMDDTQSYYSQS